MNYNEIYLRPETIRELGQWGTFEQETEMIKSGILDTKEILMSEQVLCFPEETFNELGRFTGFNPNLKHYLDAPKMASTLHFVPRDFAETTERIKQIIAYNVLTQDGKVFVYQRTKKGGEARLHDKFSLGCGGHANLSDIGIDEKDLVKAYINSIYRELEEEVGLERKYIALKELGCLYLDDTPVNRVHWGVVYKVEVPNGVSLTFQDPALDNGAFLTYDEVVGKRDQFEGWSQTIIDSNILSNV